MVVGPGMDEAEDVAFDAFVRERGTPLLRLAVLLTGDLAAGEDLLQSTLERVYGRWMKGPRPEDPDAYTRTALLNAARRSWRRRETRREVLVADAPEAPADSSTDTQLRESLLGALKRLPIRMRAVVALRHFEGYTEREVAELLGCRIGTVETQAHRGLHRLREDPELTAYLTDTSSSADHVMEA